MIREKFLTDTAVYKKYLSDNDDGEAVYKSYTLTSVLVRRHIEAKAGTPSVTRTYLYFFPLFSECIADGETCDFPIVGENDLCYVNGEEKPLKAAELYIPISSTSSAKLNTKHIKLTLR